jgi:hypothetical protein
MVLDIAIVIAIVIVIVTVIAIYYPKVFFAETLVTTFCAILVSNSFIATLVTLPSC